MKEWKKKKILCGFYAIVLYNAYTSVFVNRNRIQIQSAPQFTLKIACVNLYSQTAFFYFTNHDNSPAFQVAIELFYIFGIQFWESVYSG